MIMRLIIVLLLIYLVLRVIRYLGNQGFSKNPPMSERQPGEINDVMIQDPWCHVYFPKREGVHLRSEGKDLYFCSVECRDSYEKSLSR